MPDFFDNLTKYRLINIAFKRPCFFSFYVIQYIKYETAKQRRYNPMTGKKNLQVVSCEGFVKIAVEAGESDGRYSESFVTEMSKQLTPIIESAVGVEDITAADLTLALLFAPDTFMEHISDNVTYRRLLLLDGVSAPRDFWVRWTRLDGVVAHHLSDEVNEDNIAFELGEDVLQKIREKEYRYLVGTDLEKYHDAISRRNVTEWREIIKRLVRRGELTKVEVQLEISPETIELEARLADLLGRVRKSPESEPIAEAPVDEEFERAMEKARRIADPEQEELEQIRFDEIKYEEIKMDEPSVPELLTENEPEETDEEKAALDEIVRMALEALKNAKENPPVQDVEDSEPEIIFEEIKEDEPLEAEADESETEELIQEEPEADEPSQEELAEDELTEDDAPTVSAEEAKMLEENIRKELEAQIRLEYESRARIIAEEKLSALRREQELMRIENERIQLEARREQEKIRAEYERLLEQAERAQAVREAQEAVRRAEEEKIRAQIEAQLRQEAHERQRLAESARLAIEEQNRMRAEAERAARQREEEARIAEENRRREEDQRRREEEKAQLEAMRVAELERIRREAEEERLAAQRAMPVMGDGRYTYTSKTVRFLFRRSVDPNITTRIYEIIKATLEYYGKDKVYLKIKASVPDAQTVCLEFVHIPLEEMQLLGNIIKILGNSGLGIAKAIIE